MLERHACECMVLIININYGIKDYTHMLQTCLPIEYDVWWVLSRWRIFAHPSYYLGQHHSKHIVPSQISD